MYKIHNVGDINLVSFVIFKKNFMTKKKSSKYGVFLKIDISWQKITFSNKVVIFFFFFTREQCNFRTYTCNLVSGKCDFATFDIFRRSIAQILQNLLFYGKKSFL